MAILPTGTVTFLFTDIEESTSLWQRHPAAMPTALARHHDILYRDPIPHYWEALAVWQKMGRRGAVARLLECFGFIASAQGRNANPPELTRLETAIRLLGAGDALRQIGESQMVPEEAAEYAVVLDALKGAVDEEIFRAAWVEGREMTMEQAIAYARQEVPA